MNVLCHKCGHVLAAITDGGDMIIAGQAVNTGVLVAVVLKCTTCGRTRTWYLEKAQPAVQDGQKRTISGTTTYSVKIS